MSKYIELGKVKEMVFNADISMAETEALYKSFNELPTIDIVRCEDCIKSQTWKCPFYRAGYTYRADDFCSDGERIEE